MEQKRRTILVIAIAITVFTAVLVSFGLPSFGGSVPTVLLPDTTQESPTTDATESLLIAVTPETVQSVISTLSRPETYYREMKVTLSWTGGTAETAVRVWADGDWFKTITQTNDTIRHQLMGENTLYLWYDGDSVWQEGKVDATSADLAQRIPTYEDVLAWDTSQITDAGYGRKNEKNCVYVEVRDEILNCSYRYWIETASGLLYAAESIENGTVVYQMEETLLTSPMTEDFSFALPDGTVLHSVVVEKEDGGDR